MSTWLPCLGLLGWGIVLGFFASFPDASPDPVSTDAERDWLGRYVMEHYLDGR